MGENVSDHPNPTLRGLSPGHKWGLSPPLFVNVTSTRVAARPRSVAMKTLPFVVDAGGRPSSPQRVDAFLTMALRFQRGYPAIITVVASVIPSAGRGLGIRRERNEQGSALAPTPPWKTSREPVSSRVPASALGRRAGG